jgi:hypothetical protein
VLDVVWARIHAGQSYRPTGGNPLSRIPEAGRRSPILPLFAAIRTVVPVVQPTDVVKDAPLTPIASGQLADPVETCGQSDLHLM